MDSYGMASEIEKAKPARLRIDRDIVEALDAIAQEAQRARIEHGRFASAHEGMAVLYEEVEELWCEVRRKRGARDKAMMRVEARQIAAMAVKFLTDVAT